MYWHFQDKEALYLQCLKRLHGIFDEYIFNPMRAENDAAQGILTIFVGLSRLLRDPIVQNGRRLLAASRTLRDFGTDRGAAPF